LPFHGILQLTQNTLISDGADSTYKVWSLASNIKIPQQVFYDTDDQIKSADFRADGIHVCMDNEGNIVFRNINKNNEFTVKKLPKQVYNFVKFNQFNEYEYYVSGKDSFRIYDIRTFQEICEISQFRNSLDIYNDNCHNYLISKRDSVNYFSYDVNQQKFNEIKNWELNDISCLSINNHSFRNPDIITIGCDKGDLYYSNIIE